MPAEPTDSEGDGGQSDREREREKDREYHRERDQEHDLESQRRWQTRDDRPRGYRERMVEGGLNSFNKRPMETMLAVIVVAVGFQMYVANNQTVARELAMDARYAQIVAERKEEREHDATERQRDRDAAEKRLQEVLVSNKDTFQRVVDHLKFLSDAFAKMNNQQTLNFGHSRGETIDKMLKADPTKLKEVVNNALHATGLRSAVGRNDGDTAGSSSDGTGGGSGGVGSPSPVE